MNLLEGFFMVLQTYKVLVLGDGSVGKTTFFQKVFKQEKEVAKKLSVRVEVIEIKRVYKEQEYSIELYDLPAGELSSRRSTKWYYGTSGAIILFDITRVQTFRHVNYWIDELINYNGYGKLPIVLVGNKTDLKGNAQRVINSIDPKQFIFRLNRTSNRESIKSIYMECSAKNDNVTRVINEMLKLIVKHEEKVKSKTVKE